MQGRVSPPVHRCVCPPASLPGCIIRGLYGAPLCGLIPHSLRSAPSRLEKGRRGWKCPLRSTARSPRWQPAPRRHPEGPLCRQHRASAAPVTWDLARAPGGSASEPGQTPVSMDVLFAQSYRCTPISVCDAFLPSSRKGATGVSMETPAVFFSSTRLRHTCSRGSFHTCPALCPPLWQPPRPGLPQATRPGGWCSTPQGDWCLPLGRARGGNSCAPREALCGDGVWGAQHPLPPSVPPTQKFRFRVCGTGPLVSKVPNMVLHLCK